MSKIKLIVEQSRFDREGDSYSVYSIATLENIIGDLNEKLSKHFDGKKYIAIKSIKDLDPYTCLKHKYKIIIKANFNKLEAIKCLLGLFAYSKNFIKGFSIIEIK